METRIPHPPSQDFLPNLLKILAALGVIVPFALGIFQYRQSVQEEENKNFRMVVENLASEKVEERLAAITNLGTYMNPENKFYDAAFDILINLVSTELNSNTLSAIRNSLEKVKANRHAKIIQSLLEVEQNIFAYEYPIQLWSNQFNIKLRDSQQQFQETHAHYARSLPTGEKTLEQEAVNISKAISGIESIAEQHRNLADQLAKIDIHHVVIGRFVVSFLDNTLDSNFYNEGFSTHPHKFKLYQNRLNSLALTDANLRGAIIKNSALSSMTLDNIDFSGCIITHSTFTYTSCRQCDFSSCSIRSANFSIMNTTHESTELESFNFNGAELKDVYFFGSNLKNADFENAKNLKPEYFYGANNIDQAAFDEGFRVELQHSKIELDQFIALIGQSTLSNQTKKELCENIYHVTGTGCD